MSKQSYPRWMAYPRWRDVPLWINEILDVFQKCRTQIDTNSVHNVSNDVLRIVKPGLENIGFEVERGKFAGKIKRPVLFGEYGIPDLEYHIDSYDSRRSIALEVEAGRSFRGNAIYRDIIQASLMVGVDFFVVAVPIKYRYNSSGKTKEDDNYEMCKSILDAIYNTSRFSLPFKATVLIGY